MTPREFCESGRAEGTKGMVHVLLMAVSGACLAYNTGAWLFRRERHLAANVALYGALTVIEGYQVARHWTRDP
jgi:hypothetical protein